MVFGVCKQIESAVMRSKDVANEQKTETLALGFGGEKRSEEILRYSRQDAMTIVGGCLAAKLLKFLRKRS